MLKKGDVINGYRIMSDPTTSGGGRCVWAFATKDNNEFFLKQFLDPKWPNMSSMGSAASKEARRRECLIFENRHRDVNQRINPGGATGGNLVSAVDFFREGTTYYKVTERVSALSMANLGALTLRQTAVVLRTLCQSVRQLHRNRIVHGDLKPENVLLQRSDTVDLYQAKVIDFDDSYPSGDPPPPDQIVGDQRFAAPEWLSYVKQDDHVTPAELTTMADIFTLALVFHVYLTGDLPGYDQDRFGAPAEAIRAGETLEFDKRLHPNTVELMGRMTVLRHQERPTIDLVLASITEEQYLHCVDGLSPVPRRPVVTSGGSAPPVVTRRVRINLGPTPPAASTPRAPAPRTPTTRLRKNFDSKE